jgi:predicted nucleic acid-binding protein
MGGRLYVDSNVFIAMLERSDDLAGLLLRLLSTPGRAGNTHFLTSELTLAEILVLPYRTSNRQLASGYGDWVGGSETVEARAINRSILLSAAELRAAVPSLRLPDAIHLATAKDHHCTRFLTFDKRLAAVGPAMSQVIEFIQPDRTTTESLVVELAS